jgi:hypothetical protein
VNEGVVEPIQPLEQRSATSFLRRCSWRDGTERKHA